MWVVCELVEDLYPDLDAIEAHMRAKFDVRTTKSPFENAF
jgi:hypothetical protein